MRNPHFRSDGRPKISHLDFKDAEIHLASLIAIGRCESMGIYKCYCGALHIGRESSKPYKVDILRLKATGTEERIIGRLIQAIKDTVSAQGRPELTTQGEH